MQKQFGLPYNNFFNENETMELSGSDPAKLSRLVTTGACVALGHSPLTQES